MSKNRDILYISLFLVLILLLWTGLSLLPGPAEVQLPDAEGGYDLTGYDFEDTVYITAPSWESWPEKLYEPEDLAGAEAPVPHQSLDFTSIQYATHRLRLTLSPGVTYGISLWTSDYAMRLYIDGREIDSVGVPGATREETVPRVRDAVYYFTPQGETTELVVQASNFVHKEGGWAPVLTIGTAQNITRLNSLDNLKSGLIFGGLLVAGLYNLAIFLLNRRQKASLLFAALCLLLALLPENIITLAFSEYNWQLVFRLEYIAMTLACAVFLLLIDRLFPDTLRRTVLRGYLAFCGVYIAVVLLFDTTFSSRALVVFQVISAVAGAYALARLLTAPRPWSIKKILTFVGIGAVVLFSLNNALYKSGHGWMGADIGQTFNATAGMLVLVFCYAVVLSIEQVEVNQKLTESAAALAAAETRYLELSAERQKSNKGNPPPAALSDFGLTKRETEVALLLLDGKSRAEIAEILFISLGTVNTHCTNVYRKTGASGAAELTRLMLPDNAPG